MSKNTEILDDLDDLDDEVTNKSEDQVKKKPLVISGLEIPQDFEVVKSLEVKKGDIMAKNIINSPIEIDKFRLEAGETGIITKEMLKGNPKEASPEMLEKLVIFKKRLQMAFRVKILKYVDPR